MQYCDLKKDQATLITAARRLRFGIMTVDFIGGAFVFEGKVVLERSYWAGAKARPLPTPLAESEVDPAFLELFDRVTAAGMGQVSAEIKDGNLHKYKITAHGALEALLPREEV